jgi:hypothetical protein
MQVKEAKPISDWLDEAEKTIEQRYPAWGQERTIYTEKLPLFIMGARTIVQNSELMDDDSTVRTLSEYLQMREMVSGYLSNETNPDVRAKIREAGYATAFQLRQRDIGFADFYDQYLARDDFREV